MTIYLGNVMEDNFFINRTPTTLELKRLSNHFNNLFKYYALTEKINTTIVSHIKSLILKINPTINKDFLSIEKSDLYFTPTRLSSEYLLIYNKIGGTKLSLYPLKLTDIMALLSMRDYFLFILSLCLIKVHKDNNQIHKTYIVDLDMLFDCVDNKQHNAPSYYIYLSKLLRQKMKQLFSVHALLLDI